MKKLLSIILFLPLLLSAQGEKNFIDQNYIEVAGKAELQISPDLIYIAIVLREGDSQDRSTISSREKKMMQSFKDLGIDVEKDLRIKDMSGSYKDFFLKKDDVFLTKEYSLLVHDGLMAGKVFSELKRLNITNARIEKLDHSKMEEYTTEVKIKAAKAAYDKANALAGAVGQSAGRALYIRELEFGTFDNARESNVMFNFEKEKISDESNIEFNKIILNYSVLCRFELK